MKLSCNVIKDLLPLYVEKITSEDSDRLVEEHLAECVECTEWEQKLKEVALTDMGDLESNHLKIVKKDMQKRKKNEIVFVALLVMLVLFITFSFLTKPQYISRKDSGVTIDVVKDNHIYINFSEKVTSCKLTNETWEKGDHIVIVEAWTSIWDRILGKSTPSMSVKDEQRTIDTIYYCTNKDEINNMSIIYSNGPNSYSTGIMVLPRLVLNYYFLLATVIAIVMGVIWFIIRKRGKLSGIFKRLFFIPVSYLTAQILLNVDHVSFTVERDFMMSIIAALIIYGIYILGIKILNQKMRDRQLERVSWKKEKNGKNIINSDGK